MTQRTLSLLLFFTLTSLASCTKHPQFFKESGERFHTYYHITYEAAGPLTEAIDSTMKAFNAELNVFEQDTYVSRWNRNETDTLRPMLRDIVLKASEISYATGGAYDITGAPLFDLWGFGTRKGVTSLATDEQVDSVLTFVGYEKMHIDTLHNRLTKDDARLIINPSSISKGYVTDLVAKTLEHYGVKNYMVEIGGEIVCKGRNPKGKCWTVGISKPSEDNTEPDSELVYTVELCDKVGLASSGDYRNYKVIDGKKVAHTIDVTTGYPAHQDILSTTVIAPTCMEADGWATAFMSIGLERSKAILESQPQLSVLFIYADHSTRELKSYERGLNFSAITDEP